MQTNTSHKKNPIEHLQDFLSEIRYTSADRMAIIIKLSKLRPYNRETYRIQLAANFCFRAYSRFAPRLFLLPHGDIILFTREASIFDIERHINGLKQFFPDDPLFQQKSSTVHYYQIYNLGKNWDVFSHHLDWIIEEAITRQVGVVGNEIDDSLTSQINPYPPANLDHLIEIFNLLQQSDISNFIRQQPICWIERGNDPKIIAYKNSISLESVEKEISFDVSITKNKWLFTFLTSVLDKRMFSRADVLLKTEEHILQYININSLTVLTHYFKTFDERINPHQQQIVCEFDLIDVIANHEALNQATDFLSSKGYTPSLCGVNSWSLKHVDFTNFGFKKIRLNWSLDLLEMKSTLQNIVRHYGEENIVLSLCDDKKALEFGQDLGICFFHGYYITDLARHREPNPP